MTPLLIGGALIAAGSACAGVGAIVGYALSSYEREFWRRRSEQTLRRLYAMRSNGREIDLFDEQRRRRAAGNPRETPPG